MATRGKTAAQTNIVNIRKRLRKDMELLARSHRGCQVAVGCGCLTDKALGVLVRAERELFEAEIQDYSKPSNARRVRDEDGNLEYQPGSDDEASGSQR